MPIVEGYESVRTRERRIKGNDVWPGGVLIIVVAEETRWKKL